MNNFKLKKNEQSNTDTFSKKKCFKDYNEKKQIINTEKMKLLGPISYYYYPEVDGRKILLLGDWHTPTSKCLNCYNNDACMNLNEYLTRIIRQDQVPEKDKKCIDFFMETEYQFSEKQKKDLKYLKSGGAKRKCTKINYSNKSTSLKGTEGRFFTLRGKVNSSKKTLKMKKQFLSGDKMRGSDIDFNVIGTVCDKNKNSLLFKQKSMKKCVSRKELGVNKDDIILRNTYLDESTMKGIPISVLPKLNTLQYVRENFDICNDYRDFCNKAYPYLRYHYFDTRQFTEMDFSNSNIKDLRIDIGKNKNKYQGDTKALINPQLLSSLNSQIELMHSLNDLLQDTFKPLSIRKILQNLLLFKIGEETKDNIGERIYDLIEKETINYYKKNKLEIFKSVSINSKKMVQAMALKIQKQLDNIDNDCRFSKPDLIEFIVNSYRKKNETSWVNYGINTFYIDIYLLARMFRKYNKKSERGASGCMISTHKNIIIYAGQLHINKYNEFFREVYKIKPTINIPPKKNKETGEYDKCINIPHINPFGIPIFDKKYATEYTMKSNYWD